MKILRIPALLLSLLLQVAPVANMATSSSVLAASPLAIVLKWFTAVVALGGAVHAVSGATARLASPTTATGTVGVPFTYKAVINDGQNRTPGAWTLSNIPAWLKGPTTAGIFSGTPDLAGIYKPTITAYEHSNKKGASLTFTLTINIAANPALSPPVITNQPADLTVIQGQKALFTVGATNISAAGYRWFFGGSLLSGATNASLTLSNVTTARAGLYSVVITNVGGSVTSRLASLTVLVPPTLTTSPQNQSVKVGDTVTFAAAATGSAPLTFQWKHGETDLPGQTNPTLTLSPVAKGDAGPYRVVVSNAAGTVTSDPAILIVTPKAASRAPQIGGPRFSSGGFGFSFVPESGIAYRVEVADSPAGPWTLDQLVGPFDLPEAAQVAVAVSERSARFVRLRSEN